jgi:hypothetical protein
VTYGSGARAGENAHGTDQETSRETASPAAGEMPVPGLSQLKDALRRAVEAEEWGRVAELAQSLANALGA